ncbi:dihydropyrimidine dehydrogenase [Candidatus Bathyarchaeota archaeon]|nr:dihydropyrimidine dehydrogenase [Candidatus Bathyarchaeota archaeon]
MFPDTYNPRTLLHNLPLGNIELLNSAALWLCAWCNRCYNRCPQKINLPEIFQALRKLAVQYGYTEGFYEALRIIREKVPLPASCCYVCFHPNRAIEKDKYVNRIIKKFIIDFEGKKKKTKGVKNKKGKVAIVGSGPAGLSAAQVLALKGYKITIYESHKICGGMLRNCIPEYRLPKNIVDFEVNCIKNLGVKIKKNQEIGKKLKMETLLKDYDAVFLATGATKEKTIDIEGRELKGVFYALDFLEKANLGKTKLSGKVLVIGGGDVAVDCARTALKLGAKESTILYRRSKEEMPANLWEVKEAERDGVKIEYLVAPKRIIGKKGRVVGIQCVKNELGELDDSGRRRSIAIPGSEFEMEANYIIVAIGQYPNTVFLPDSVEINRDHTIAVNPFTLETTSPCVFAGGDVANGPATLIEAILAGKQAAETIDNYLKSLSLKLSEIKNK